MHPNEDWIFVTLDADEENTFPAGRRVRIAAELV